MSPWFIRSFLWHISLLLFFTILNLSLDRFGFIGKREKLVKAPTSIRVDVVAMPTLTLREQRQLAIIPFKKNTVTESDRPEKPEKPNEQNENKNEQKVDEKVDDKDEKLQIEKLDKKKKLDDLLKGMSEKLKDESDKKTASAEKTKEDGKEKPKWASQTASELKNLLLAGNKLSKGIGLEGANQDQEASAFSLYIEQIVVHLRPFWKLPSYLLEKNLKCRIRVYLSAQGDLMKAIIYESSGDAQYDERAIDSIKQASPFPIPPDTIKGRISDGEIILGFPI